MGRRRRIKKPKKFLKRMQKKLIIMFLFISLALTGLVVRLMYIEYTSGEKYEKIVLAQQVYNSTTIPYQRGDIIDTKGTVLATSMDVYNVIFDCSVLSKEEGKEEKEEERQKRQKEIDATISAIVTCFPELKKEELYQKLEDNPNGRYEVLLKKVSYEDIQPYLAIEEKSKEEEESKKKEEDKKYPNINRDAIWFEKEYVRSYPYNSLAASLIGFVSGGNVGTNGLEKYYDSTLNGLDGREYGYLNADNNFEKTIKPAEDGNTIVSTIDIHIQKVVEDKLAKFNEENTNGYITGDGFLNAAAIVMNPQNGEIYAMADFPGFDLNKPREITDYFTPEELEGLDEDAKMELLNRLWENFCVTYTYEPGSTVKPLTVACGLETGTLSGNEAYVCDGVETFAGDTEVHCVSRVGHGTETVEKAIMDSCNDALMQMSYVIGKDNFTAYQNIFGFGKKTGIDLPGEESGLLFSKEKMKPIDLATNSFGQNFNCTMIQVASAFSSLINGGEYYQPHVVKKILDAKGNTIETIKPVLLKETVSRETSDQLKTYLYKTVSEGTGKEAKVNGYSMGGKTGTAQKQPRAEKNYLVSFIGYLPQENPQLVIYVVIDTPNVAEQDHSNYAQGIVKEILEEILPYLNIYPDEELQPEEDDPESGQEAEGGAPEDGQEPEGETPEGGQEPEGGVPEGGEPENPE